MGAGDEWVRPEDGNWEIDHGITMAMGSRMHSYSQLAGAQQ